jgi:hypothetical protein
VKEQRVQKWIDNFNEEIKSVETEFRSFFKKKPLKEYYRINIDNEIGYISIEILDRKDLPMEIIDSITVAFLRAKPRY